MFTIKPRGHTAVSKLEEKGAGTWGGGEAGRRLPLKRDQLCSMSDTISPSRKSQGALRCHVILICSTKHSLFNHILSDSDPLHILTACFLAYCIFVLSYVVHIFSQVAQLLLAKMLPDKKYTTISCSAVPRTSQFCVNHFD